MIWRSIAMLKTSLAAPSYFSKSKQKKERIKSRPKISFICAIILILLKIWVIKAKWIITFSPLLSFFEICFRLRFDISHLKNLWAVGASWRARWPGSQILILIFPMLMLMWPILILILMWPIFIYTNVTDIDIDISFPESAPESLSCTAHKRQPLHLLYTPPGNKLLFRNEELRMNV